MWRESFLILVVAAAVTTMVAFVRGLPDLSRPATEATTCTGPLPERPSVQWISHDAAGQLLDRGDVAFVDTRDQADYEAGHIAGSLHAPMDTGTLDERLISSLRAFTTIVAYCDASGQCARSTRFASLLSTSGFADVRVLEGGISAWLENGRPAESGECRQCR